MVPFKNSFLCLPHSGKPEQKQDLGSSKIHVRIAPLLIEQCKGVRQGVDTGSLDGVAGDIDAGIVNIHDLGGVAAGVLLTNDVGVLG